LSEEIVFINGRFNLIYQPLLDDNEAIVDGQILSSTLLLAKQSQECPKCSSVRLFIYYWNSSNCKCINSGSSKIYVLIP
jgi:hypothetical protein